MELRTLIGVDRAVALRFTPVPPDPDLRSDPGRACLQRGLFLRAEFDLD